MLQRGPSEQRRQQNQEVLTLWVFFLGTPVDWTILLKHLPRPSLAEGQSYRMEADSGAPEIARGWGRAAGVEPKHETLSGGEMSLYKRGGVYWYEFVFNGRRYRGTTDIPVGRGVPGDIPPKEKAKQVENAKRHKLALEAAGIPQPDPPPIFSDYAVRFLKWVSTQRAEKPRTVTFYRTRVGLLQKFDTLKNAQLDAINGQLIANYVEWRKGCARTKIFRKKSGLEYAEAKHNV